MLIPFKVKIVSILQKNILQDKPNTYQLSAMVTSTSASIYFTAI